MSVGQGVVDELCRLAGLAVEQMEASLVNTEATAASTTAVSTTASCSLTLAATAHSTIPSSSRNVTAVTWSTTQTPLTTATQVACGLPSWSLPSVTPVGQQWGFRDPQGCSNAGFSRPDRRAMAPPDPPSMSGNWFQPWLPSSGTQSAWQLAFTPALGMPTVSILIQFPTRTAFAITHMGVPLSWVRGCRKVSSD